MAQAKVDLPPAGEADQLHWLSREYETSTATHDPVAAQRYFLCRQCGGDSPTSDLQHLSCTARTEVPLSLVLRFVRGISATTYTMDSNKCSGRARSGIHSRLTIGEHWES